MRSRHDVSVVGGVAASVMMICSSPAWANNALITDIQINILGEDQVEILLVGEELELLQPSVSTLNQTIQIDLEGVQLQLQPDQSFQRQNPTEDISSIRVVMPDPETVMVEISGESGVPQVSVTPAATGLEIRVVGLVPESQAVEQGSEAPTFQLGEIEVTATQDRYRVAESTTATRTPVDLKDLPLAVQVIPEQVIEDQGATELTEVLRNISGVNRADSSANTEDSFIIRGFNAGSILRDGFRDGIFAERPATRETANLEQVEVLKGPASILQGQLSPGGVINLVTKQPLREPFFEADVQLGRFGFIRSTLDLSGPLNESGSLRYRLNAVNENDNTFRDFTEIDRQFVAPVFTWDIGDQTTLTIDGEYLSDQRPFDRGLVALGTQIADIPFSRRLGEPFDISEIQEFRIGYLLEHQFSEQWSINQSFRVSSTDRFRFNTQGVGGLDESTGLLSRNFILADPELTELFLLRSELTGQFNTGQVEHRLLMGVEAARQSRPQRTRGGIAPELDIFNPVYLTERPVLNDQNSFVVADRLTQAESLSFYALDVISISEQVNLLLGGRLDLQTNIENNGLAVESISESFTELTPQVGLVYQPSETLSLYTNYSESFNSNPFALIEDGTLIDPETGRQFEVGLKAELLDERLTATLALYQVTRENVPVSDPNNPTFVIPVGEQRSRGVELDLTGELLPGWDLIASYAFIDAEVTEDTNFEVGNRLENVPMHSGSIWTTYEFPEDGSLRGLTLGMGLFAVGERQGDSDNSFTLDPYALLDAAILYRGENASISLNFKNILDQQYIESGGTRTSAFPGEPFTMQGSVSVNF